MREVVYKINGIETRSYAEKKKLEQEHHTTAEVILRNMPNLEEPLRTPIQKAMLEQFGFVSPNFRDKVVLP